MMIFDEEMIGINYLTSDEKLEMFGYGEWVEEAEELKFIYRDYECHISRHYLGYLCGYVKIPEDHLYFRVDYDNINIDCHGGITFGDDKSDGYWIGFDCAHSMDIAPHIEKRLPEARQRIKEIFPDPCCENCALFNPTYKNVNFCIQECKGIVDQLILAREVKHDC